MADETLRSQAVALAKQGRRVFPLLPNGKTPAVEGGVTRASSDPERVRRFWSEAFSEDPLDYNIGIATGDGLVVLDVDNKGGKNGSLSLESLELRNDDLPVSFTVSTPTHGRHVYLAMPDGAYVRNSASKLGEGLDIRGDGGYVVGPGSIIDGKRYEIENVTNDALSPQWFTDLVTSARPVKADNVETLGGVDEAIAAARAKQWLKNHAELSREGDGGDTAAYRVAARVMDFGLSPDDALDLMLDHWNDRCEPPWEPEQLEVIVNNAAQYRQKPIGADSADVEFDVVELAKDDLGQTEGVDDMPVTSGNNPFEYQSARSASAMALTQSAKPLIEGLLDQGAMSMLYAPPGAGKTFVTIDWLYHIAAGKPWAGRKVEKGLAVHLAAEGGGGVRKRYKAYDVTYGCAEDLPLVLISVSADLRSNKVDCKRLIATIRAAEAEFGMPCAILAIDTLSRVLAGGDENSSVDGGALVKNIDEVRAAIKAHTMLIHHTGKAEGRGARGWSGFKAALDTELEIKDGAIHVTKQRDLEFAEAIPFSLKSVDLGLDSNGNAVTSAVVEIGSAMEDFDSVLTDREAEVLDALTAAAQTKYGTEYKVGNKAQPVSTTEWRVAWQAKTGEIDNSEEIPEGINLPQSSHSSNGSATNQGSPRLVEKPIERHNLANFRMALAQKGFILQTKRSQWVRII